MSNLSPTRMAASSLFIPFAFSTFLWAIIDLVGVQVVTPDLMVVSVVFLASGLVRRLAFQIRKNKAAICRIRLRPGVGYYAKAVVFPLGLTLIAVLFICPPAPKVSRKYLVLSTLVFLGVAAPLILMISNKVGRPTFSEVGRLNYGWHVNHIPECWVDGRCSPWCT